MLEMVQRHRKAGRWLKLSVMVLSAGPGIDPPQQPIQLPSPLSRNPPNSTNPCIVTLPRFVMLLCPNDQLTKSNKPNFTS